MSFEWEPYLEDGEEVLWEGQHDPLAMSTFRQATILLGITAFFAFGLPLLPVRLGLLGYSTWTAYFAVSAIVGVLMGLAMAVLVARGRAFGGQHKYAITNRRALSMNQHFPKSLVAFPLKGLRVQLMKHGIAFRGGNILSRRGGHVFLGLHPRDAVKAERIAWRVANGKAP